MKKIITILLLAFLGIQGIQAQSNTVSLGGEATGSGGSASFTVGEVFYTYKTSASGSVTEGVQQGYISNPTAVISGSATVCSGIPTPLSIAFTGQGPWSGTLSDGTPFSGSTNPLLVNVTPTATITYTIASLSDAQATAMAADLSGSAVIEVTQPAAAPGASAQSFCVSGTVADLVASGTAIQWYADATGGTALTSDTALVTGTTYYASQTENGCESSRTSVDVTVNTTAAINAPAQQSFCNSATVEDLQLDGGVDFMTWLFRTWYAAETGGTYIPIDTPLVTGTYYVSSQFSNGCETRTAVDVTVNNSVAGTVSADQLVFIGTPPANITLTGNEGTVQWQSSLDNSTFADIAEATGSTLTSIQMGALTTKRYYRAVVTSGSCASATSAVVTVNVVAPTKVQVSQCGKTLADINTAIIANAISGATHYRFKVVNGATTQNIETVSRWFYLKSLTGGALFNKTYTISVATKHNGVWGPYGEECVISTPIFIPATKVQDSQCGTTLADLHTAIIANTVSGATHYRFKVVNGATTRYAETVSRWFYLKSLTGGGSFGTTYTISVAYKQNGVWSDYGTECAVTTPMPSLVTKVQDSQCGQTLATLKTAVVANLVPLATNYRFKIVNGATTRYAETVSRWFYLKSLTGGGLYSTTYTISVAAKFNDVWGAYGEECTVTTPSAPLTRPVDLETETDLATFKVTGSPNPYTNTFKLDINTQSSAAVNVMVYDMIGKLIEVRNSGISELSTMEIGDRYATGVYNVIVTQGTEVKTLRMIKK